ncbi:MAG TPA: enoyl-CoA hydratase-related protein [Acidimicrobiia bacterium]|nr:enoyl-CoA hydratase-related protein [Acidimicrobiia bacterium]
MADDGASDDLVLSELDDGVLTLTLNRPDRLNAWNPALEHRYFDVLDAADDDPDVRVIVVTGAGRGFCAGADSAALEEGVSRGGTPLERTRPLTHALSMRKLMIAAINGGCAGIGLVQALCCDVRFAAEEAKIASAFVRRGLAPEFGVGWLLTRVVGSGHAADLLLSSRAITGAEAERIGLVSRAVPRDDLLEVALDYAHDVARNCSPRAIAYAKADLLADWNRTAAAAQRDSAAIYDRPGHEADFAEGVQSFVDKRAPAFENVEPRASSN